MQAIDSLPSSASSALEKPLRMPVTGIGKGPRGGVCVSGRLAAGALKVSRFPYIPMHRRLFAALRISVRKQECSGGIFLSVKPNQEMHGNSLSC